ncbi:MAG: TolC family protein [Desulfobulbaceae bacterium]|nr:TolC family protein [Desulfobulbaceae bacterium]
MRSSFTGAVFFIPPVWLLWFMLVPAAVPFLSGCASPDHWYDLETMYKDHPVPERVPPVEPALPTPEFADSPLAEADQGSISLSHEQAVFLALSRNRELRVQQYEPVIAGTFEQIERAVYDLELFAELTHSEESASETARSTGEQFNVEGRDLDVLTGFSQRLPTGTDLEASLGYAGSTSNRTPEQQEIRAGLTITQSLLKGLGPAVNLVDIRQAQLASRASLYELRGFVEALVAEVETAYWRFVLAEEGIAIFEHSLTIARQQLDEVEKRIEVGVLPRNAAAAARAEVARREQALIESYSIHNERRLRLLRLLNASGGDQFHLAVKTTTKPRTASAPPDDLNERLELAERSRPDLNEARLRLQQHRLEVVRTRNGLLPRLDLFINLGKTGYAGSFGDALKNMDQDSYDLAAGIRFSTYLGNREAEARHLAARATREQADAAVMNLRNLVQLDVRLALNETERTSRQIEASAVTRALQEQTLEAEQERFSIGASTSLLVAQAQRDLLVSQLAEIEAIVEYRIALVNLYLAEGSLLERRGIQLAGAE